MSGLFVLGSGSETRMNWVKLPAQETLTKSGRRFRQMASRFRIPGHSKRLICSVHQEKQVSNGYGMSEGAMGQALR